jgi:hypothetical protein
VPRKKIFGLAGTEKSGPGELPVPKKATMPELGNNLRPVAVAHECSVQQSVAITNWKFLSDTTHLERVGKHNHAHPVSYP